MRKRIHSASAAAALSIVVVVGMRPVAAQQGPPSAPASDVVAEVNGEPITRAEVERPPAIGQQIARLEEQIYGLRRQRIEAVIGERLLAAEAARRKMTVSALIDAEINSKVSMVTETEIDGFVDANKGRLQGSGDELREAVRAQMQRQKAAARRQAFLDSLRARASVVMRLVPPPVFRVDVPVAAAAGTRGPADAPITIVEFTDFHCPFCREAQSTVAGVLAKYPGKIRQVHHDLPIDSLHPQARKVHEAARCVGEQGKFWEFRELAFVQLPKTAEERAKIAAEVGANLASFQTCVAGDAVAAAVRRDEASAQTLNVSSTPIFYINGRQLVGAQPLDAFVRVIEDELERARAASRPPQQ